MLQHWKIVIYKDSDKTEWKTNIYGFNSWREARNYALTYLKYEFYTIETD